MPTASDSHDTPGKNVPTQIVGDETRSASEINSESGVPNDDAEPVCANCGGVIGPDDLVCPHCGISLVSG